METGLGGVRETRDEREWGGAMKRKITDSFHTGLSAHERIGKLFGNLSQRATISSHVAVSV